MVTAAELRHGALVNLDNRFYKVVESVLHAGAGKAGSMVHAKLRCLETGAITKRRFNPADKLADVAAERVKMQYLYADGKGCAFMNPQTYDQVSIPKAVFGPAAQYLKEGETLEIEFHQGRAISVKFPPVVELKVASAGAGVKGSGTMKEAVLENGMNLQVPQFIQAGDLVRVEVETGKYLDRGQEKK